MKFDNEIISKIEKSVRLVAPNAIVILYGSFARGTNRDDSDIDILILLDKDRVTRDDEKKVKYPLYGIEFDTGQVISPLVLAKYEWETKHRITPFFEYIKREGILL
ncbi:MAG: putative nucleotidyltransferase [Cyclobacteriaceae bacterium]|jgi:predicted nucleotidyltransferase